jgi:transposase-like protein
MTSEPLPSTEKAAPSTGKVGEPRKCTICAVEKLYTVHYFPAAGVKPTGTVCRDCAKRRRKEYEQNQRQKKIDAQAKSLAQLARDPAALARAAGKSPQALAKVSRALQGQLEAATALSEGAAAVNKHAKQLLETIISYAQDRSSIHHEWALKLLTERIIPRRLYEELGAQAAGIKSGEATARPSVTVIIQPSAGPAAEPAVRIIEAEREPDMFA